MHLHAHLAVGHKWALPLLDVHRDCHGYHLRREPRSCCDCLEPPLLHCEWQPGPCVGPLLHWQRPFPYGFNAWLPVPLE